MHNRTKANKCSIIAVVTTLKLHSEACPPLFEKKKKEKREKKKSISFGILNKKSERNPWHIYLFTNKCIMYYFLCISRF